MILVWGMMMKIKRTEFANHPSATVWVQDQWEECPAAPMTDAAHVGEYPTHSPVLGLDGRPLQYESRPPIGFYLKATAK